MLGQFGRCQEEDALRVSWQNDWYYPSQFSVLKTGKAKAIQPQL